MSENAPSVFTLDIRDKNILYAAYMQHVVGGGIFIPTERFYRLGEEIYMLLSLLDDNRLPVSGKVAWITPKGAQGIQGIGVRFNEDTSGKLVRARIEEILGPMLKSNRPTHTL